MENSALQVVFEFVHDFLRGLDRSLRRDQLLPVHIGNTQDLYPGGQQFRLGERSFR